jgi:hypothetical protein
MNKLADDHYAGKDAEMLAAEGADDELLSDVAWDALIDENNLKERR